MVSMDSCPNPSTIILMDGAFQVGDKGLNLGRKNVTYRTMVRGIVFVIHLVISLFGITCRMRDLQIMPRQLFLIRSASGKNTATRHNPGRGIIGVMPRAALHQLLSI